MKNFVLYTLLVWLYAGVAYCGMWVANTFFGQHDEYLQWLTVMALCVAVDAWMKKSK